MFCSEILDGFDGMAARHFDQCSHFGAVMDMVADRSACAFCYMIMSACARTMMVRYIFLICLILDFGSHWLQFLSMSLSKAGHKTRDRKENFIVAYYYNNRLFFCTICLAAEFSCVSMWLLVNDQTWLSNKLFMAVSVPLISCLCFKMFVNIF